LCKTLIIFEGVKNSRDLTKAKATDENKGGESWDCINVGVNGYCVHAAQSQSASGGKFVPSRDSGIYLPRGRPSS
jgi:hypothetical protein